MQEQNKLSLLVACVTLQVAMAVGPSGLTQPGAPADCIMWYSAKEGDTASGIAAVHNIPLGTFMDANPQLSGDPMALWEGYNYCVPQGSRTPPAEDSSEGPGVIEVALTAEDSSTAEAEGLTSDESVATSKDPTTRAQSTESSHSSKYSQSNTASEESDTSSEYQSVDKSTTQTTMTKISTPPSSSTTTMAIPAPITDKSGTESAAKSQIKSETEIETHGGDQKDTDGLAESFGAARRDLKRTETMEPRNLAAERAEPPIIITIREDIILKKSTTYTSTLETPVTVTYTPRNAV